MPVSASDRREVGRVALAMDGRLAWAEETVPCRLRNISVGGARIALDSGHPPPERGSEARLILEDSAPLTAEVRWTGRGECGLAFDPAVRGEVEALLMALSF